MGQQKLDSIGGVIVLPSPVNLHLNYFTDCRISIEKADFPFGNETAVKVSITLVVIATAVTLHSQKR